MTGPGPIDPPQPRLGWSLRRWFRTVAILGTVALLAAFVLGLLALTRLTAARTNLVDRTGPALLAAQSLTSALVNQESGIRGFAATGDPAFAQPYRDGLAQQAASVADLRRVIAAAPPGALATDLDTVLARAEAWQRDYAEPTMARVNADGPGAGVDPAVGKTRFDAVRAALGAEVATLQQLRTAGRAELDAAVAGLTAMGVVIAVVLVALFVGTWVWARLVIMAPISALATSVRAVQDGEFGRPVTVGGPTEVVELGRTVESMRDRIAGELVTVQGLNARLDHANQQLEEQKADLARSNSDLEQFAYVASHDLQEPLRKVSSFCELLAKRYAGQLDERADQYIGFAVDGARRMSALINDLLAFSRVGRTTGRDSWGEVGADDLLAQAERNLADAVDRTGATITHDSMPAVTGEASLLVTVFQNLVGNAVKFHGDEPPVVHVGVRRAGAEWEFRVSDNGIGIDAAYADRIFVIFQRLHAKATYPGTGIGLALCRRIVEYHGGRIWLDPETRPEAGSGTTFRFTLPVEPPAAPIRTLEPTPEQA